MSLTNTPNKPTASAAATPTPNLAIVEGAVVEFHGLSGIVRFVGKTEFATGVWVGIELNDATGKNDGSVQGKRYFECKPNYGVFVRASQIKNVISVPQSAAGRPSLAPRPTAAGVSRPTTPVTTSDRRPVSAASTGTRESSPSKLPGPTKLAARPVTPEVKKPPVAPPTASESSSAAATPFHSASSLQQLKPASGSMSVVTDTPAPVNNAQSAIDRRISNMSNAAATPLNRTVSIREFEELKVRLKLLEAKRIEDKEKLKQFERIKSEHEQMEMMKTKSSSKIHDLQNEIQNLKKSVKEAVAAKEQLQQKYQEAMDNLELITLDKEMAEEKAENLQIEMDLLKEQVEELSLNLEVLQEERTAMGNESGLTGGGGAERVQSVEAAQLEKQNERLKEALIKLRDVSTTRETELDKKVKHLEKEQSHLHEIKEKNEELQNKLAIAEENLEHVKDQLDDALENNDLIEMLTVKNLKLSEMVEEQKESIQDLEALRDLNEELEENHVETEKELNEEIEYRETEIRELNLEINRLNESNADYENTILQFRELVKNLQSDISRIQNVRDGKRDDALSSQSQKMLELNMQLQNTAMKNTAKAIELELRKMEAKQTMEELQLVKSFLPLAFFEVDSSCFQTFFSLHRISFKADLIIRFTEDGIKGKQETLLDEEIACLALIRLKSLSLTYQCQKIISFSSRCTKEQFLKLGMFTDDLDLAEAKLDNLIDILKSDDLKKHDHVIDIQRILAQMDFICYKTIGKGESVILSDHLGPFMAKLLDLHAETVSVIGKQLSEAYHLSKSASLQHEIEMIYGHGGHKEVENVVVSLRLTCKKIGDRFVELAGNNVLKQEIYLGYEATYHSLESVCILYQRLNEKFRDYLKNTEEPSIEELKDSAKLLIDDVMGKNLEGGISALKTHILALYESLNQLYEKSLNPALCDPLPNIVEPWKMRAEELQNVSQANPELESQFNAAQEEIETLKREVKAKEENYNQSYIKVQLLEKRIDALRQQSSVVDHYEKEIKTMKEQEKDFMEAIEALQSDIDRLEQENRTVKEKVELNKQRTSVDITSIANLPNSRISALYKTLKVLQSENAKLKSLRANSLVESLRQDEHVFKRFGKQQSNSKSALKEIVQESKMIIKDAQMMASSIKVVDISQFSDGKKWKPMATRPEYQYHTQMAVMNTIKSRSEALETKINHLILQKRSSESESILKDQCRLVARVKIPLAESDSCRRSAILLNNREEFEKIHAKFVQ